MKQLLILFCTAFACIQLNAQDKPKTTVGINAGLNLSQQSIKVDNEKANSSMKPGIAFGVFTNIPLGHHLSLQPGLQYSSLGGHDKDGASSLTTKFKYLALPVLLKINVGKADIYLGPQIAYLLSARARYTEETSSNEDDIKELFKGTDLSLVAGLDISLSKSFSIGLFCQEGITDLLKTTDYDNSTYRNNNIQFSISYSFGGGKK